VSAAPAAATEADARARIMAKLASTVRRERRTDDSMATPCSVNA